MARRYTGHCVDYGPDANRTCDLCGETTLRYTFEIDYDDELIWVGSECVKRFDIDGILAVAEDLKGMKKESKEEQVYTLLRLVSDLTGGSYDMRDTYDVHKALSPKQALTVFRIAARSNVAITVPPKICLRRLKHQQDYINMAPADRTMLLSHMSPSQQAKWFFYRSA